MELGQDDIDYWSKCVRVRFTFWNCSDPMKGPMNISFSKATAWSETNNGVMRTWVPTAYSFCVLNAGVTEGQTDLYVLKEISTSKVCRMGRQQND